MFGMGLSMPDPSFTSLYRYLKVKLLLYYASGDARLSIRLQAYSQLLHIAIKAPHTWTEEMLKVRDKLSSCSFRAEGLEM